VKTKYQDVSQKEATKDKTYVAQPFLRQGWSNWRGKNKILKV
jgi:hypothetical protein